MVSSFPFYSLLSVTFSASLLSLGALSSSAHAAVAATSASAIYAASCEFSAVEAASASAALGQTVIIPKGRCDWGAKQLTLPAGVAIKGAGRDLTVLRRTAAVPVNTYLVKFDCWNGKRASFSDMTLEGAMVERSEDRGLGLVNGCVDFKVWNAKFTKFTFAGIEVRGAARQRGVIYKSQFIDNYNPALRNLGYGVAVFGDGTWPALELGTANAVFVEENYMSGNRHHITSNNGARYVFRYNTAIANDKTKDFPLVDAHGLSSAPKGTRSWEVYNNAFSANLSSGRVYAGVGMRGGDGIISKNSFSTNIARPIVLQLEYDTICGSSYMQDQIRSAYAWSNVNGAVTSLCPLSIAQNRDYFLIAKSNYKPYNYPHPLRTK